MPLQIVYMVAVPAIQSIIVMLIVLATAVALIYFLSDLINDQIPRDEAFGIRIVNEACSSSDTKTKITGKIRAEELERKDLTKDVMAILFNKNRVFNPSNFQIGDDQTSRHKTVTDGSSVKLDFDTGVQGYATLAFYQYNDECQLGVVDLTQNRFIEKCSGFLLGKQSIKCGDGG